MSDVPLGPRVLGGRCFLLAMYSCTWKTLGAGLDPGLQFAFNTSRPCLDMRAVQRAVSWDSAGAQHVLSFVSGLERDAP